MERLPKKNLTAKIIALIMAVTLWVYVMNEQNPPAETTLEVPLEVRNLSNSVVAVDIPETVRVKVRGPRSLIMGLAAKDVKSYIDLKGLSDGRNTLKVTTAIPSNMELVEVSPEKISFRLDSIASRQIPVETRITGTPPAGAIVGKVTSNLPTVTVKGPSELIDNVAKVIAEVDVTGKTADFTISSPLVIIDDKNKRVEGVSMSPGNVSISVAFTPAVNKKVVDIKPNVTGTLVKGIVLSQITIKPPQVELSGEAGVLEKIDFVYTEPINLSGVDKTMNVEAKLQLKEGVAVNKNTATVTIEIEKAVEERR